jgi:membrane-associated phospholipid phosphatase
MIEQLLAISINLTHFLQSHLAWLTPVMEFFTFLGNEEFYLIVMPVFLWAINYDAGIRLGLIMLLSGSVNTIFKFSLRQPRPYWVSSSIKNLDAPHNSFGLPSGHSQNAASLFGTLATMVKQKWLSGLMIVVIVGVGFSRLFLGVHSLQDIILGFTLGALLVFLFAKYSDSFAQKFRQKKVIARVLIAFVISAVLLFAGIGIRAVQLNCFTIPTVWNANALAAGHEEDLNPYDIGGLITSTGAFFGIALGGIWVNETGGFIANQGVWWKRTLRFIIGILGVLFFWKILGDIFPRNENFISYLLRYLRYILVGFWVSGLAPKTFSLLKIAEGKDVQSE